MSALCPMRPASRARAALRGWQLAPARCAVAVFFLATRPLDALAQAPGSSDWGYYGGDALGQHFSTLDQINRGNVARLAPAWTYRTGELGSGFASARKLTFEATPVLAFGLLYLETASNVVIALDAESGRERWRFDPHIDRSRHYAEASARGVSLWSAAGAAGSRACRHRVFTGTLDARLLALDADRARHQPIALLLARAADVDDEPAARRGVLRAQGCQPAEAAPRNLEQLIHGHSIHV